MKIIDEKGRLFKLINIVDLLVIMAILLVIGGITYALSNSGTITVDSKDQYLVTIKCSEVTQLVYDNMNENDKFVYGNIYVNGYIKNKYIESAKIEKITDDNKIIYIEHPTLFDVYIDVIVEVDHNAAFILLGKYQINIGKELVVKTARVEVNGLILDLKEYSE